MSNQPDRVKMFNHYRNEELNHRANHGWANQAEHSMLNSHALLLAEQAKKIKELKERVDRMYKRQDIVNNLKL